MKLTDWLAPVGLILILISIIRRENKYKKMNLKPGDIVYVETGDSIVATPYGVMLFPKNITQLKDFIRRFFLPSGFMNTLGSVAYWFFFTFTPSLFIFMFMTSVFKTSNQTAEKVFIIISLIIILPIILMLLSGTIKGFIKKKK